MTDLQNFYNKSLRYANFLFFCLKQKLKLNFEFLIKIFKVKSLNNLK